MNSKLSKSRIISGLQCAKRLWLETHQPEQKAVPAATELVFAIGHEVNDVARSLYPRGHLIGFDDGIAGALAETARMMRDAPETTLFEATFAHQGVAVRADILAPTARGHRLIEVKASTKVKPEHHDDCAVQAWVLDGCGLKLERVELAHIDNQFIYRGDGDYNGLLHYEDLSAEIDARKNDVPGWVRKFKAIAADAMPNIEIGAHCHHPYSCPFIDYCWTPQTKYPVESLPGNRGIGWELRAEGIIDIRDIPHGRLQKPVQERVRRVTASGVAEFDLAVQETLRGYGYPRYYLDFETITPAVPIWKDTGPYQQLPFQWSCHVESKSGKITHKEFLNRTADAPMRPFIESMLAAVGDHGSIFVYSSFEKRCLNELVARFPDLDDDINAVIVRLVDLCLLTRDHYYHPDMLGSWSLKNVLPTISDLHYDDLGEVQYGSAAGVAYREMLHPETEPQRAQSLAHDLLQYCKRDTEALVALAHFLASGERIAMQGGN